MPLRGVVSQNEMHHRYLDREECPYSDSVKDFLHQFLSGRTGTAVNTALPDAIAAIEEDYSSDKGLFLEKQVLSLFRDLEEYNSNLRTKDSKEKMDYFKMKNVLIVKLIEAQERVLNLREMSEFQVIILQFLDEVCDTDQRSELMKRLEHLNSVQTAA